MELRLLNNNDMLELVPLYVLMIRRMDENASEYAGINALFSEINHKQDFMAFGLFEKEKLVGFMTGYYFSKKQFHFSGIYVTMKNTSGLKKMIDFSLDCIRKKGYSAWSSDATNSNISRIMQKYGAKAQFTHFVGEL